MELRSPDPLANPYIAYALLIYAGIEGIENNMKAPTPTDLNLYSTDTEQLADTPTLPQSLTEANAAARDSEFVSRILPQRVIDTYTL